jgi:hypothetical protein
MNKHSSSNNLIAITGLIFTIGINAYSQQFNAPAILSRTGDQLVQLNASATFSASADGDSYQWRRNGVPISGQSNSTFTLKKAQIADAGLYSCDVVKDAEIVSTSTASLLVYIKPPGSPLVVYGTPIVSSGSQGTCPGSYAGYVNYTKAVTNGWGWAPDTNTVHSASDTSRTNTSVEYVGKNGDEGCALTTVTVPDPPASMAYRFTIYFPSNVPTTNYPITLSGFNP